MVRFSLPEGHDEQQIEAFLTGDFVFAVEEPVVQRRALYDTFDWRLWNRGARLILERTRGALALRYTAADGEALQVVPVAALPRLASDLPDGPIRSQLHGVLEMRALIPLGEARLETPVGKGPDRLSRLAESGTSLVEERPQATVFFPLTRVEKIFLDEDAGIVPSVHAQVRQILGERWDELFG